MNEADDSEPKTTLEAEPKTRAADPRMTLLVALSHFETRFELLQKRLAEAEGLSPVAVTLIRNELNGLTQAIERVLAAVEHCTKAAKAGPPVRDRF